MVSRCLLQTTDNGLLTKDDFGPDAGVGEDFEEERVPASAVDQVGFRHAGGEAVEAGFHFGNHAGVDDAAFDQIEAFPIVQAARQRGFVLTTPALVSACSPRSISF